MGRPMGVAYVVVALALVLLAPAQAAAAPSPKPYRADDFGGFRNILPPGSNGRVNAFDLAAFLGTGMRPPHNDDQLGMYDGLLRAVPGLQPSMIERFFKDASFGVQPEHVERTYSPRDDVTIQRDNFGVPHIYGDTRIGAMFGIGYASAEDRLFFMDVLRHLGRGQVSSFAGGAPANRDFDRDQWRAAPYTEEDLQAQVDRPSRPGYEREAAALREDLSAYLAGINKYIAEARLDPTKMPGEYAAIGRPEGAADFKGADVVAIGSLVGAILGSGGGAEVESAIVLQEARKRFGRRAGDRLWTDFRSAEDPEAPVTAWKRRFEYGATPRKRAKGSLALPDPGSVRFSQTAIAARSAQRADSPALRTPHPALKFPKAMSNALLVAARESESGKPIAVFGPQTGYFAPEVLMEQDVHAPGIDARGVAFPGTNVFVQIGHGQDYAWSATTSAQDLIDTFAVDLCEPDGSKPTVDSMHYRFRGACRPIEVLERKNSWQPNAGDPTPAGSETLRAERTLLGIVTARATIKGKPVVYTRLRASYRHEPDSGLAFSYFNDPAHMKSAKEFQRNAFLIPFTFNWFYIDDKDIAYFSAGTNPQRAKGTDPNLPIRGVKRFEWKGFDPEKILFDYTPPRQHPQFVNQAWAADWNNKQGRGYRASDSNWGYGPEYRVKPLRERVARGVRGAAKMNITELIEAMEDSATVDIRGRYLVPLALAVLGRQRDPSVRDAVTKLRAWLKDGAHRIDRDGDGSYEHSDAIRIMDAWWPRWVAAEFQPVLGKRLFDAIRVVNELSNDPNNHGDHLGSAWQNGWYGYVSKDLRSLLGRRVKGPYSKRYCGRGSRARCRSALAASLKEAAAVPAAELYKGDEQCVKAGRDGDQTCWDAIWFRPLGAVTQPLMPWQNRPTFQQVVEIQGHRPR